MNTQSNNAVPRPWIWIAIALVAIAGWLGCKKSEPSAQPSASSSATTAASAAPSASSPASAPASFLWKVEGSPGAYLLGTIHVPDDRVSKMPPVVATALSRADAVFTEIPMDAATQVRLSTMLMLPKGKTLKTVLPNDLYARTEKTFLSKGLPLEPLSTMKVWAIGAQLVLIDRVAAFALKKPIDAIVFDLAQGAGKEVGGIETIEEQVAAFDSLSMEDQIYVLRKTLDDRDRFQRNHEDPIEELLVAYLSGSEEKMVATIDKEYDPKDEVDVRVMKRLLSDRNVVMANRIAEKIKANPSKTMLFAIGTAHLVGKESVVQLLKGKGLSVSRAQ